MEITDVLFAIVPILFVVVFISVFTVVIVTIVKGISSSGSPFPLASCSLNAFMTS